MPGGEHTGTVVWGWHRLWDLVQRRGEFSEPAGWVGQRER